MAYKNYTENYIIEDSLFSNIKPYVPIVFVSNELSWNKFLYNPMIELDNKFIEIYKTLTYNPNSINLKSTVIDDFAFLLIGKVRFLFPVDINTYLVLMYNYNENFEIEIYIVAMNFFDKKLKSIFTVSELSTSAIDYTADLHIRKIDITPFEITLHYTHKNKSMNSFLHNQFCEGTIVINNRGYISANQPRVHVEKTIQFYRNDE